MQTAAALEVSDAGLQLRLLRLMDDGMLMAPEEALVVKAVPAADAATVPETLIGIVPDAAPETVTVTVASVPFWIAVEFNPLMRQEDVPLPDTQLIVLEAAVAALPADTVRFVILEALYVSVHCTEAGSLPAGEFRVRFNVALPPAPTEAEDNDNVSAWPNNEIETRLRMNDILSAILIGSDIEFGSCRNVLFQASFVYESNGMCSRFGVPYST